MITNQRLTIDLTNKFIGSIKFVCLIAVNRWFACNWWFSTNKIVSYSKLALNLMNYNDLFDNYNTVLYAYAVVNYWLTVRLTIG